jgi:type II secretory pathway pseudopilin PulG
MRNLLVNLSNKPVLEPFTELLHTQRFILLVLALIGYLVAMLLPQFVPAITPEKAQQFGNAVLIFLGLMAGALQVENLAETVNTLPTSPAQLVPEIVSDVEAATLKSVTTAVTPGSQTLAQSLQAATMTRAPATTVKGLPYDQPPETEASPDRSG